MIARGEKIPPLLPQIERLSLYDQVSLQWPHRPHCPITATQVEQMRDLRRRGILPNDIGLRLRVSHTTVRRYTKGLTTMTEPDEDTNTAEDEAPEEDCPEYY